MHDTGLILIGYIVGYGDPPSWVSLIRRVKGN